MLLLNVKLGPLNGLLEKFDKVRIDIVFYNYRYPQTIRALLITNIFYW